jgi:hypothetical protein
MYPPAIAWLGDIFGCCVRQATKTGWRIGAVLFDHAVFRRSRLVTEKRFSADAGKPLRFWSASPGAAQDF